MSELDELVDRFGTLATPPDHRVFGVVDARHTGPPATVDVFLSGSTVVTPGLRFLQAAETGGALAAFDVVVVDRQGRDLIVVGRLA